MTQVFINVILDFVNYTANSKGDFKMAFRIITDSASDLPASVKEEYGVYVMPTPVTIDGKDYFDGDTIFPEEFYKIQAEGTHDIKTYHISQYMFEEHFKKFAEAGDDVLYICFSTGIAGTFQAANLAMQAVKEEYPNFDITIIDSKCASIGYGLVVENICKMQRNGAPKDLIIEAAKFFCEHMEHVIIVKTLDYLHKGGRVGKVSFVVGGMLDIKPIIVVDENGALKPIEKARGWKRAQARLVEMVGERGKGLSGQTIGVVYGADRDDLDDLKKELKTKYKVKDFLETQIGCAIGAHTGPEILAATFLNETTHKFNKYLK